MFVTTASRSEHLIVIFNSNQYFSSFAKKMEMFEYLLFDFDNTLVDFHGPSKVAFKQAYEEQGLTYDDSVYKKYKQINGKIWDQFENGEITTEDIRRERFKQLFEKLDIKGIEPVFFNSRYMHYVVENTILYSGVKELLIQLKEQYKLAIVTNGLKEAQRARLDKVGISDLFEVIVVSDEIGFAKPEKAYFDFVHQEIGKINKEHVLVIGDNPKSDIKGANEFGYKSCWINATKKESKVKADYEISTVLNLPKILSNKNVSCDFYDELEIKATYGKELKITYLNADGKESIINSQIKNLQTVNKKEFLITKEGERIRLDHIIAMQELT